MIIFGIESWQLLFAFISSLPLIYWYLTRNFSYWTKQGLKGPNPKVGFGNIFDRVLTPMPMLELEWFKKFGKLYGVFYGNDPVLTIVDPQLIKLVLVKDFNLFSNRRELKTEHPIINKHLFNSRGDDWKRLRSITSPTFTSGKMKRMYPLIRECLREYINNLETYANEGKDINLKEVNGNLTMDVIASCAFATKTNAQKDPSNEFTINGKKIFAFKAKQFIPALVFPKFLNNMLNIKSITDESANQFFINITRHILKTRRNNESKYHDFIQLLMDAKKGKDNIRDKNDANEAHHVNEGEEELEAEKKALNINVVNKQLTEDEILAQSWIFFVAGYETTATTLSFCSYELALNPESQEKLYEEVNSAVDSNGELSYETLAKLPFLDSVLSETLRLYPPVIRLEREVTTDYKLGDTGITLFKGQLIEIPTYAIHHSEEYYPDPEKFIPERFMPQNRDQITPYTYIPFGAGPRNCIGMRFALMEAKLALAQIVRRFRFVRNAKTEVPLKFLSVTPLCAAKSLIVGIQKR